MNSFSTIITTRISSYTTDQVIIIFRYCRYCMYFVWFTSTIQFPSDITFEVKKVLKNISHNALLSEFIPIQDMV